MKQVFYYALIEDCNSTRTTKRNGIIKGSSDVTWEELTTDLLQYLQETSDFESSKVYITQFTPLP